MDPDKNDQSRGPQTRAEYNNIMQQMAKQASMSALQATDQQDAYFQREKLLRKMSDDQIKDAINILSNIQKPGGISQLSDSNSKNVNLNKITAQYDKYCDDDDALPQSLLTNGNNTANLQNMLSPSEAALFAN